MRACKRLCNVLVNATPSINLRNVNNTPDIGFLLGYAFSPAIGAQ
jgi:hypothetical protein